MKLNKTKKVLIICLVPLLAILLGFSAWAIVDNFDELPIVEEFSVFEKEESQKPQQEEKIVSETEKIENESITPEMQLSQEDIDLNNEIAKVLKTKVVFHTKSGQTIGKKSYDLQFDSIDIEDKPVPQIIYKNANGDKFDYSLETGKLRFAIIKSVDSVKDANSITLSDAKKIAENYAMQNLSIEEYPLIYEKETDAGYEFAYIKKISGYKTTNGIVITVAYNGEIIRISDRREEYAGKNIVIDEEYIEEQKKTILGRLEEGSTFMDEYIIYPNEDGPALVAPVMDPQGNQHYGIPIIFLERN